MYGDDFHPILRMAENATILHKTAAESKRVSDLKASIDAWDKVARYTEPMLKTVDIGVVNNGSNAPTEIILKST